MYTEDQTVRRTVAFATNDQIFVLFFFLSVPSEVCRKRVPREIALIYISLRQKRRVESSRSDARCRERGGRVHARLNRREKISATRRSLSLTLFSLSPAFSLFLPRVRYLAHFVPHSGHTYAVAPRTSSKFTARERAAGTDARLRPRRAAPLLHRRSRIF